MGKYTYSLTLFVLFTIGYEIQRIYRLDYAYPEIGYSIGEFIEALQYPFEKHTVVTEDGYILEMHRIPCRNKSKTPILLMHGLHGSSMTWLFAANNSLPIYLAKRGYDVWLGNARGNDYSRKHIEIDPDVNPGEFFNFSWHEIGAIDGPAMIDYILQHTGHKKLVYTGYSQGTTVFYAMMSEKPEYNEKVDLMIGLAPVAYMNNLKSITFNFIAASHEFLEWIMPKMGLYELSQINLLKIISHAYCQDDSLLQPLCGLPLDLTGGFNTLKMNATLFPLIYNHFPAGISTKQLFHFSQLQKFASFQNYDYRKEGNILRYGQSEPHKYFLNRTTVPVAILWSSNDWVTSEQDLERLYKNLPNVMSYYKVPCESFNHFDFIFSKFAEDLYFPVFLKTLETIDC